jgi:hypothetical protein
MGINEAVVAVVGILVGFGMPITVVAMVLYYFLRKARLKHQTILSLAEKGMPVPPELIVAPQAAKRASSDLKVGIVLFAAGAGISLFFLEVHGPISLGAIPGLMGIGYMVAWKLEKQPQPSA